MSVLLASTVATRAAAQPRVDPMAAAVAESFTLIERQFVAVADAMPAEKYGFKPTAGEFKDASGTRRITTVSWSCISA